MATRSTAAGGYWDRQWKALLPFLVWLVYIGFFALHIVVRSYGDDFLSWRSPAGVDHALTGTDPSLWLQKHLYGKSLVLDRITTGAHLLWYGLPFFIGAAITVRRRQVLLAYLAWLTAAWFVCDVFFFLFPTMPPWMVDSGVTRVLMTRGWVEYAGVDTNPVAAFPSLHVCIPVVIALFLRRNWPEAHLLAWISGGFGLLVGFSVVYLGEHWVVDVLGGIAVAFGVRWLVVSAVPRVRCWGALRGLRVQPGTRRRDSLPAAEERAA